MIGIEISEMQYQQEKVPRTQMKNATHKKIKPFYIPPL
jgi:hypothetical protein